MRSTLGEGKKKLFFLGGIFVLVFGTTLFTYNSTVASSLRQTTPRPANGEMVHVTPVCFVFPTKVDPDDEYLVEYSTNPLFPTKDTVQLRSPYMLACPRLSMKPGHYYWRWRPSNSEKWSVVRAFTVSADAVSVPFPDVKTLIDRVRGVHPRIFLAKGGVPRLRDRAKKAFGGDKWIKDVHEYARRMSNKKLLPEPAFLPPRQDPRHGALYQKTFRTTRPFFREMARLAENYLLTGDELSGLEAKRRLLHIISWDPGGSTGIRHNDEPATEIVRYCSVVYDRIYSLLTDAQRQQCLDSLTMRMRKMRERWYRKPFEKFPYESHNMGYFLPDLLLASLALAGDAPVDEILHYTMLQLWSPFYPPFGGDDGGWNEGPGYWSWSTAVFTRLYKLVELASGVPIHERSSFMRHTALYKLYANPPYYKMSPFGDGQAGPARGGTAMLMLAALYQDPYAKWYAEWQHSTLQGLNALLFDSKSVQAKPPYDLPQGRAFFDVGLVAMHTVLPEPSNNVSVLLRSSPYGSVSHSYADQNTFTLDAYGEPLIIASGYYQLYGSPHHKQWTWTTQASNSVLVNGEGQAIRDREAKGRIIEFQNTRAGDYAVGDATAAYQGRLKRFRRRIVFLRPRHTGGEPIVVIRDELTAVKPSTFQFLLHALKKMRIATDKQRVTIQNQYSSCRVDFLAPSGISIQQTNQFTVPPVSAAAKQWHLTASTVKPAAEMYSLMVIQPYRQGKERGVMAAEPFQAQGCAGVRLKAGARVITVLFRTKTETKEMKFGQFSTDAQVVSLCTIAGRIHSAVRFGGTYLWHAGQALEQNEAVLLDGNGPVPIYGTTEMMRSDS